MVPNASSTCFEGSCYTLSYLAEHQHLLSMSNDTNLLFFEGLHTIDTVNYPLIFANVASVQITVEGNSEAHILCHNSGSLFGFIFTKVQRVSLSGINFSMCTGTNSLGINAGTITFHWVNTIQVENITVSDSDSLGISGAHVYGRTTFENIRLESNRNGNMNFLWNGNQTDCELLNISFTVKHSLLVKGGAGMNQSLVSSGGLSLLLFNQCVRSDFLILGTQMLHNSGQAGGNLGVSITETTGTVFHITIQDSTFEGGRAVSGGGVSFIIESLDSVCTHNSYIQSENFLCIINSTINNNFVDKKAGGILLQTVNLCHTTVIHINDSQFTNNAISVDNKEASIFNSGGAILIISTSLGYPLFSITHSIFRNNTAGYGGGLSFIMYNQMIHAWPGSTSSILITETSISEWNRASYASGKSFGGNGYVSGAHIQNVTFTNNKAKGSCSAMCVLNTIQHSARGFLRFTMEQVHFNRNILTHGHPQTEFVGTVLMINVHSVLLDSCTFAENNASALVAVHSGLVFQGEGKFTMNHGVKGGALALYATSVLFYTNTSLLFTKNSAKDKGGALYIHDSSYLTKKLWQGQCQKSFQVFPTESATTKLEFYSNTAEIAGDVLYGGLIEQCSDSNNTSTVIHSLLHYDNQTGPSTLTSDPIQICLCNNLNQISCNERLLEISTLSGVPFTLSFAAVGLGNGLTPATVQVQEQNKFTEVVYLISSHCTNLTYTVHSSEKIEILHLNLISEHNSSNPIVVRTLLSDCPIGFILSGYPLKCQCSQELFDYNILCNTTDFTISRHGNAWVGLSCLAPNHNCTKQVFDLIIHKHCPLDYCKQGVIALKNNSDHLCMEGRTGLLCTKCQTNLSVTLGGNTCKECSNSTLALLVVFVIAGLLLIFILTSLNLTVTEGAINGLIFFAGVVHVNRAAFFQPGETNILTIFLSWVNLDFGFHVCFYDGMTVYVKTWLQFVFPVYVVAIAVLIIIASEYSQTVQRITRVKTRINVMCTLFLLVYLKILRTITMAISFTYVTHSNSTIAVWLYDGSSYTSGKHIPLLVVSVVVTVLVVVPYTVMLLFSQWLQRLPYFRSQWALKFMSIMEAYSGPFKFKYRFWIGLLLLMYTILMVVFFTTGGEYYTNLTAITVCSCLLVLVKTLCGGVYKKSLHDVTESFYLLNLCILSVTVLFSRQASRKNYQVSTYTFVSVAFIVSLLVLITHIYSASSHLQKFVEYIKSSDLVTRFRVTQSLYRYLDHEETSEHELQSNYHEASHLAIPLKDLEKEIRIPDDWIPTNYPTPDFREDPVLLSESIADGRSTTPHPETCEDSHTESSSSMTNGTVQSVVLIVDRNEDEAVLVEDPKNEPVRSKFTSIDTDGNTSTIIEDITCSQHKSNKAEKYEVIPSLERQSTSQAMFSIPEEKNEVSPETTNHDSPDTDATGQKSDTGKTSDHSFDSYLCSSFTHMSETSISRYPHVHTLVPKYKGKMPIKWNRKKKLSKHILPTKSSQNYNRMGKPDDKITENSIYHQCTSLEFLADPLQSFTVTSTGKDFIRSDHDIAIRIPPGAVYSGVHVQIEVGVLLHGPFVFPDGVKPISPILWVCTKPVIEFQKPVEIVLPHILSALNDKECKVHGVTFLKARHRTLTHETDSGLKKFKFESTDDNAKSRFSSSQGTLRTNHFCCYCIAAKKSRELYRKANYCITRVDPKPWPASHPETTIYFCVSYFLSTCIQVKSVDNNSFDNEDIVQSP